MARLGVYVADGFVDDCEELIHKCSKNKPLTYHTFCSIWKSMNFASLYQGRTTSAEIAELTEEVLLVAKRYMLARTKNFEETVAGLFLVYALLNLQPFPKFAALRITPDDVPAILYIEETVRKEKRYDALYILGVVIIKGPCQFHAADREYGMEIAFRKNFEGIDDKYSGRPRGVFNRKNEEFDILDELNTLTQHYEETKAAVTDNTGRMDRNLNYVEPKFANEMESSLKKVLTGLCGDEVDEHQLSADRHTSVQAIKNRAVKGAVNFMGHLTGVKERAGPSTSTAHCGIKTKGVKVKTSRPKKPMTTGSPRRRNAFLRPKKEKRRFYEISGSDSDNDEDDIVLLYSDGDEYSQADNSDGQSQADIDEASVVKDPKETRNTNDHDDKIDTTEDDAAIAQLEKEINIEIDTLPVLIRKSQNKNIEIEFIDNFKQDINTPSTSKVKGEVKKDLKRKLDGLKEISIVKNTSPKEMNFIFKRPARCYTSKAKLVSKQDSKQVNSTLKTMGFTEMADIGDK